MGAPHQLNSLVEVAHENLDALDDLGLALVQPAFGGDAIDSWRFAVAVYSRTREFFLASQERWFSSGAVP